MIESSGGNGTKQVPKVQKTHLLSPWVYPSHYFPSFSSAKGRSTFLLFLSEGMQYMIGPQFIDMNLLTFLCMYSIILLLMTDEYTELIFYFVTFHIYIYLY